MTPLKNWLAPGTFLSSLSDLDHSHPAFVVAATLAGVEQLNNQRWLFRMDRSDPQRAIAVLDTCGCAYQGERMRMSIVPTTLPENGDVDALAASIGAAGLGPENDLFVWVEDAGTADLSAGLRKRLAQEAPYLASVWLLQPQGESAYRVSQCWPELRSGLIRLGPLPADGVGLVPAPQAEF
jgi:hypothetical protein